MSEDGVLTDGRTLGQGQDSPASADDGDFLDASDGGGGQVLDDFYPLVDGRQTGGSRPALQCINPSTAEPFARVHPAGAEDIDRAVESAVVASAIWRGTPFAERSRRLFALADLIRDEAEGIAGLIALEQGKPVLEALTLEILPALDHLRFVARQGEQFYSGEGIDPRQPLFAHKRAHTVCDPLGVVALVTPFNLPFALPLIQAGAALAMGNAVVIKPSELAPLSGLRIGELCLQAGIPPGLVNVVPCRGEEAFRLVAHAKLDKIFFTGTLATGQLVMATAGCAPRPVVLSLSGKHPSIVAADADLDRAARGIVWGALANAGQNCGAVERVYVEEAVATQFLEKLLREVDKLRTGDPLVAGTDIGPMISDPRRQEVHAQVSEAVSGGARLLRGGMMPSGPGYFYPPTVVLGPPADCRLLKEETLGPVIPIVVVDSIERAILLANETEHALTASGWTASPEMAERLMAGLRAGVVTINDVLYSFGEPASTWSGYRRSGVGHTHGMAGLREMCTMRFVSFDPRPAEAPIFAFPYDEGAERTASASMAAIHGKRRLRRVRAITQLFFDRRFRARVPFRTFFGAWKRRG